MISLVQRSLAPPSSEDGVRLWTLLSINLVNSVWSSVYSRRERRYTVTRTRPRHGTRNTIQTFALFSRYFRFFLCSPHASLFWPFFLPHRSSKFSLVRHLSTLWNQTVKTGLPQCKNLWSFSLFCSYCKGWWVLGSYTEYEPWKRVG